ncbi:helix-turn-helix transcriptional regulator [Streptomyces durbertensis]|uniref:Helix-turn-helix transcriptional regulator n=1 Tax=Streptomyces durbertensis TaxID=2448886 RepID=A0ABR6EP53_9ACTN|nr:helix-turn-helix transcriptional regulator [Streptomyces durbertensis]MBB1246842.1 helix-turn-helix transcriptional regulator [Streptomyces durbertensis]
MARPPRELTPERSIRHLFGAEMRRYREAAGMSLERLAEIVRSSRSNLSRIETAEQMIPPELPAQLDAAFNTDGHFQRLYPLARREAHPDKYRRRMELEERACVISYYAGQIVPGLLQTEEYARALLRVGDPTATQDELEAKVAARIGRQRLLTADPRPHLTAVLDESALCRPVGGAGVMATQLELLAASVDTSHCLIQVLPYGHGEHALMGGMLSILELRDGTSVAYEESIRNGHLLETDVDVASYRRAYDRVRAYALSPTDSAALMHDVRRRLSQ